MQCIFGGFSPYSRLHIHRIWGDAKNPLSNYIIIEVRQNKKYDVKNEMISRTCVFLPTASENVFVLRTITHFVKKSENSFINWLLHSQYYWNERFIPRFDIATATHCKMPSRKNLFSFSLKVFIFTSAVRWTHAHKMLMHVLPVSYGYWHRQ